MITGVIRDQQLTAYRKAGFTLMVPIQDGDGRPVNLTGKALRFIVSEQDEQTVRFSLVTPGDITIGGVSANEVTIIGTDTHTQTSGEFRWTLRNTTDDRVIARGPFDIKATADA